MELKVKLLREDATLPSYAKPGDAGMDLYAVCATPRIWPGETYTLDFGIAVEIPEGHVGLILPRSSTRMRLANTVGVIDSGYRGSVIAKLVNETNDILSIQTGQRVVQLLIVPVVHCTITQADELSETARGEGGFGSTGQ